jgi:8-oxo-dGTP pyrophosphatase MutT (NUDIX family)
MAEKLAEKKSLYTKEDRVGRSEPPRDAATVILLRESPEGAYELLLMQRHGRQAFMGGAHVFPGGRLDDADRDRALADCVGKFRGEEARRLLQEPDLDAQTALGLFLAAIRETFEEAGVLFACDASGRPVNLNEGDSALRFKAYRRQLQEGKLSLTELARREALRYRPDLLIPYSRWITPEGEPRRFDTRFFLACLPPGQTASHDRQETTESRWLTPDAALAEHGTARIVLMPPTLQTIEEVKAFPGSESLFAAARSRPITIIYPQAFRTGEILGVLLPTDPEYTLSAWKQQPRDGEATRIVMEDGIWKTVATGKTQASGKPL